MSNWRGARTSQSTWPNALLSWCFQGKRASGNITNSSREAGKAMGGDDEGGRGNGEPSRASSATSSPQHLYHKSPQRVYGSLQWAGVGSIRRSHRLSGGMCLSYFTLDSLFFSWPHSQELLRIISSNLSSPYREAIFKQIFISFSPFFFLPLQVSLRRLWPVEKCAQNGRDAQGKAGISVSVDLWDSLHPEWALFVFCLAFSCNAITTAWHNQKITKKAYERDPIKVRSHLITRVNKHLVFWVLSCDLQQLSFSFLHEQ